MNKVFKVGLIGCGHIAETYFRAHKYFNNFKIIKCADVNSEAAKKCAKTYKIQAVSVNELLKDKKIRNCFKFNTTKSSLSNCKKIFIKRKTRLFRKTFSY